MTIKIQFSKKQTKDIIKLYETTSCREIGDIYGCSETTIRSELNRNGVNTSKKNYINFSTKQTKDIIKLYETKSCREIGKKYGYSDETIRKLLRENGINTSDKYRTRRIVFTNSEIKDILKLYKTTSLREIAKKYCCSRYVIRNLLNNTGINISDRGRFSRIKFNEKQIGDIIRLYNDNTLTEIAEKYSCSLPIIRDLLIDEGIDTTRNIKFTNSEIKVIKRLYKTKTLREIAEKYGCSFPIIRDLLIAEGIDTTNVIKFSKKQIKDIIKLYKTKSLTEIGEKYACSGDPIRKLLRENGIDTSDSGRFTRIEDPEFKGLCRRLTDSIINRNANKINPRKYVIGKYYHIDHKLSISDGSYLGLTVLDIAHPCNLRTIQAKTNLKKGSSSSLTKQELLNKIKVWNKDYGDPFEGINVNIKYKYKYGRYRIIK